MCNNILYKYRSINDDDRNGTGNSFTKNLLTLGELYFSRFSELKDPNEAIFDYSQDVDIAIEANDLDNYPNHKQIEVLPDGRHHILVDGRSAAIHVRKQLDKMNGILCLTTENMNSLMFDYYANGHTGICIGIEWKRLGLIYKENKQHQQPRKIKYCSRPPTVSPFNGLNFDDVYYTKWKEYKHEKEFRLRYTPGLFANTENVLASIREIIFGCATTMEDKELVKGWVAGSGISVNYFEAHLKPKSYNLVLRSM